MMNESLRTIQKRLVSSMKDLGVRFNIEQACIDGGKLEDYAKELKDLSGSYAGKDYAELRSSVRTFRQKLKSLPTTEALLTIQKRIDPVMVDLAERVERDVRSVDKLSVGSLDSAKPTSSSSHRSRLKTVLPKFSGDMLKWEDFWGVFNNIMETERTTELEKKCPLWTMRKLRISSYTPPRVPTTTWWMP